MSIDVYWFDREHTIVRYDFSGSWTWDEVYAAVDAAIALENSVSHRVDVVLNLLESGHIPPNAITHLKTIATTRIPANVKMAVLITENKAMNVLFNIGSRLYRKIEEQFYVAASVDSALEVINKAREQELG